MAWSTLSEALDDPEDESSGAASAESANQGGGLAEDVRRGRMAP
jgi:hypothetical protein